MFISTTISKKSIFWTKIISRSIISSKFLRFSIFLSKFISKTLKNVSFIFSFILFQKFVQMQSKFIKRFCLIVNDLYRMFVEKSKFLNLQQHQNYRFFSHIFDIRQRNLIQIRIIFIFHRRNSINQNAWITKIAKTSKTKFLHQCMIRSNDRFAYS